MTTLEALKAARAKIADRKHWTQGQSARDSRSRRVRANSPRACRWCSTGALRAVAGDEWWRAEIVLSRQARETMWHFNDTHTHAEVLALFDKAIAKLEAA